jgi:hypothetical protein
MMKNKMMRIASVLLVAVLLSTCAISGTFAKYVTSDNVADEARVAKWGVAVTATGSLFEGEYNADTTGLKDSTDTAIALSVKTSDSNKLVAPGTKNDSGMAFSITGTPEVAVNVKIEITYSDILLPDGTYDDYTTGATDTFALAADYYPVVFTLTHSNGTGVTGTLKDVRDYLTTDVNYQANENLGNIYGAYTLTWAWVIDGNDKADTYLGNCAADSTLVTGGICIEEAFGITITVTQID